MGGNVAAPASRKPTFPGSRSVACLGHSFQAAAYSAAPNIGRTLLAYPAWIPILSRQRVAMPQNLNFAVSGQTSTQIVTRVPQVVAAKPGMCIIDMITNDTSLSFAEIKANHDYAIKALLDAGIIPVVCLWCGRGGANGGISTAQYQNFLRVNDYLRGLRDSGVGMYVVDYSPAYVDPTTGFPRTDRSQEPGLHPNDYGSYLIARDAFVPLLTSLFPDPSIAVSNPLDVYDATNNPNGNIFPNNMMTGTGGGLTGSSVTGQLADGLSATINIAGLTATFSKSTMADGRTAQQVVLSGNYTGNGLSINIGNTANITSRFAVGDQVETIDDFEVDAGTQNVVGFGPVLNLNSSNSSLSLYPQDGGGNANYALPPVAFSGLHRTDRALSIVPAGVNFVSHQMRIGLKNAAASTPVAFTARWTSVSLKRF